MNHRVPSSLIISFRVELHESGPTLGSSWLWPHNYLSVCTEPVGSVRHGMRFDGRIPDDRVPLAHGWEYRSGLIALPG